MVGAFGRTRLAVVVCAFVAFAMAATVASAAPTFSATAAMNPLVQYLNDRTGTTFTVTVFNTGDTSFGAVDIARGSPSWTITACPAGPTGWRIERHVWGCRYISRTTAADNIPGHSSNSQFRIRATVRSGTADFFGRWRVVVSKTTSFTTAANLRSAPQNAPGLKLMVHSFQVTDAVIVSSARPIGSACPARTTANHSAAAAAQDRVVAICGRNRANVALRPLAAYATLGGTLVDSHGAFTSGLIPRNSGNVVIGNWANVDITATPGAGKTIVAKVGSHSTRTSPSTTLAGYTATNAAPVAAAASATTAEDTASGPIGLSATDANGHAMTFSIVGAPVHGSLSAITAAPCVATSPAPNTCTATVVYTPDPDYNGPDSFTYRATDSHGAAGALAIVSITVTPVNDAPTVTTTGGSTAYTENGSAAVDSGLLVADIDDTMLAGATVQITSGCVMAQDRLGVPGSIPPGIATIVYTISECKLAITGNATIANYQAFLRGVTYSNLSDNPNTGPRTVTFKVNDGDVDSTGATKGVTVAAVNDAPVVTTSGGSTAVTEGSASHVDGGLTVTDPDDTDLGGGQVRISAGFESGDELLFVDTGTISGVYNTGTGVLALTGTDTVANYQEALRSVEFRTTNDHPNPSRTVAFKVNDGDIDSTEATQSLTVSGVNDAPSISAPTAIAAADGIDSPVIGLSISDPDAAGDDVSLTISVGDGDVEFDTTVVGGIEEDDLSGPAGTNPVTVTASIAQINTTLGATNGLMYVPPTTPGAEDTITLTLDDLGNNGSGGPLTDDATITVEFDEAPVVTTSAGDTAATEDGAPVAVDSALTVSDGDDTHLESATVRIIGPQAGDALQFTNSPPITGSGSGTTTITLTGTATLAEYQAALRSITFSTTANDPSASKTVGFVAYDGDLPSAEATKGIAVTGADDAPVVTATPGTLNYSEGDGAVVIDPGVGVTDPDDTEIESATVAVAACHGGQDVLGFDDTADITGSFDVPTCTLTLTGTATVNDYRDALRTVTYSNGSNDPNTAQRIVTFHVSDGDLSGEDSRLIDIFATNDAPTDIALSDSTIDENEPGGTTVGTFSTTDPDSGDTHTYELVAGDGATDNAAFQVNGANLDAVGSFDFEADASYSIRVRTTDDGSPQLTYEEQFTISVNDVNEPPTAIQLSNNTVDENQPTSTVVGTLTTTDPDAGDTFTYTLVSGLGDEDNASFSTSGDQLLTNEVFDYETKSVYFVRVQTTDSGGETFSWSFSITINDINDAPTAEDDSFTGVGNTGLFVGSPSIPAGQAGKAISGSVLANDSDQDGDLIEVEAVSGGATDGGGTITIEADGDFVYHPQAGDTADTFNYRVCDSGPCSSAVANSIATVTITLTGEVWYVDNTATAGGDGTSDGPFDTLLEAEAASGTGDTVFVFEGDGTTTGLDSGIAMDANGRLIGESITLVVDSVTLHTAVPGASPTLTASNEDVVDLDDGNEIRGFVIDPAGTGGGIAGGAGDASGSIGSITVNDTGTLADQPGLELNGTSGTWLLSDLSVTTSGSSTAVGVLLSNAGTVEFTPLTGIAISTDGAKALDVFGTTLAPGSTIDTVTVTGSGSGGVSIVNTTGPLTLTDLDLTTTSGTAAAFRLSSAGSITVPGSGTANVSATGGPAIEVSGTPGITLAFDDVDSASSASSGISLGGLGTGTFSAASGDITGAAGTAFSVSGGSGSITYPGNLNNGAGATASITNRTGGTVALSGQINDTGDAGGGITVSNNSGGSTVFSNATKTLNTGSGIAVLFNGGDGHSLSFTNGGLDIDTTTGKGIDATGLGVATPRASLTITGANNTISTTTGRALDVVNTDIGASGVTFLSISANGAVNGIRLSSTGITGGGLTVTGDGTNNGSGGTIQNTTTGIDLTNTRNVSLSSMNISNATASGIAGTQVVNFSLVNSTINNSGSGHTVVDSSNVAFNTTAAGTENNLSGNVTITGNTLTNAWYQGVDIFNYAGVIADLNLSNNTITSSSSVLNSVGSGIRVIARGGAANAADITKATINNNTINNFPSGVGLQVQCGNAANEAAPAADCGTAGSGTNVVAITNNKVNGSGLGSTVHTGAEGIIALVNGVGQGNFTITGNEVRNTTGTSISSSAFGDAVVTETVSSNTIVSDNTVGSQGIGIGTSTTGGFVTNTPSMTVTVSSNNVSDTDGNGILAVARDAESGLLKIKVLSNVVGAPQSGVRQGIRVDAGNATGDNDVCLEISGNTSTFSVGQPAALGIGLRKQGTSTTVNAFGIVGLSPSPATGPQVIAYVTGQNPLGGGTLLISSTDGFTSCASF